MIAVVLGLTTALAWSVSTVSSSRSVKMLDQYCVVSWAMLIGLVLTLPFALGGGVPAALAA